MDAERADALTDDQSINDLVRTLFPSSYSRPPTPVEVEDLVECHGSSPNPVTITEGTPVVNEYT